MTEIRKAPDGWVGFHPDDPARLEAFAKWLDMLDEWCATQDGEYAPSDEIQLDARRIAEAIRSHLPETAHPVDYMTTYDEIRSWLIGNGWTCAALVWTSPDGREVIVHPAVTPRHFEWRGVVERITGRWRP